MAWRENDERNRKKIFEIIEGKDKRLVDIVEILDHKVGRGQMNGGVGTTVALARDQRDLGNFLSTREM